MNIHDVTNILSGRQTRIIVPYTETPVYKVGQELRVGNYGIVTLREVHILAVSKITEQMAQQACHESLERFIEDWYARTSVSDAIVLKWKASEVQLNF